ncbi:MULTISPECIES: hypothetical protein [unclassified Chryseobacterium]|uniref:hypothetical protein n=1 Tax=unclassified Chryseobacterium TaxID=2593645 RepID=UPI001AE21532|nr:MULTISPECIES: hypothetical protein [unclassified Chryseobacterium]MBP1163512.1 hypothetical protein [Chryseobacterium sp. PvR013]MDR4894298.1 hypothetical protein [Chryseobacterium sp. CFS7]
MKKLLYLLLVFFSGVLLAQKNTHVKFAVYNNAIGTDTMFDLYKSSIEKVTVFKTKASLPSHLKKFDYLADHGLIEIRFKKNAGFPDSLSLEMLNEQNNLPKDRPVFIEGYLFNDTTCLVYNDMIGNIELKDTNGQQYIHISTIRN